MEEPDIIEQTCTKVLEHGYASLSRTERMVFTIATLDAEVRINGFAGYLHNRGLAQWADCVEDLKVIGADRTANVLQRAIDIVDDTPYEDLSENQILALRMLSFDYEAVAGHMGDRFQEHLIRR